MPVFRNGAERFHVCQAIFRCPPHPCIAGIFSRHICNNHIQFRRCVRRGAQYIIVLLILMIPRTFTLLMVKILFCIIPICTRFQFLVLYKLPINWNSDKTIFIAFINCYILSSKSPQTLENAKFIASEFALRLSLVLYPFLSCYEPS